MSTTLVAMVIGISMLVNAVPFADASFFDSASSPGTVNGTVPIPSNPQIPNQQTNQGSFFGTGANSGSYYPLPTTGSNASITTYAECVAAGFPILKTFPAQCRVSDGRTFAEPQIAPPQPQSGSFFSSAGSSFFGQHIQPPLPTVPSKVKILAYGDSVIRGVGATSGNDLVSLLSQRTGIPITNAGVSRATSAYALQNLDTAVLSQNPDIVILFIGGNDILQNLPASNMFSNVQAMIERIQSTGASVILLGIHDPVLRVDYETKYREIATQTGAYFVPGVLEDIIGRFFLTVDYIHPNNQGYKIIADRVEPTLRLAIQNKSTGLGGGTPLPVTCSASPAEVQRGQVVTWTAVVPSSTGVMSYSWSGDENLQAYGQSVRASYRSAGIKTATVNVASGNVAGSAQCSVQVVVPPPQVSCNNSSSVFSFFGRFFNSSTSSSCI